MLPMNRQIEDVLAITGVVLVVFVIALSAFAFFQVYTQNTEQPSGELTPLPSTKTPIATVEPAYATVNQLIVDSLALSLRATNPVQATARISGFFADDGCASTPDISTRREGSTFYVTITKQRPATQVCARDIISFEERVILEMGGLPNGTYTVDVNDFSGTLTLDTNDNTPPNTESEVMPDLPQEDLAELVRQTLERALVEQEIPYFEKLTEQAQIVLSIENIDAAFVPELDGINLVLMTPEEIEAKASAEGVFPYLRFRGITAVSADEAHVFLSIVWPRPADADSLSLLGGGLTFIFRQSFGRWQGEIVEKRLTL